MAYYFNLPGFNELTIEQRAVLNEMAPIAVSGGPGTGKSVVSLWRHIRNHALSNKNSLLLTYTKTLAIYLASCARQEHPTAGKHVERTYLWCANQSRRSYDEIIIDEAQDVEPENYEKVKAKTDQVSYCADDHQSVIAGQGSSEEELRLLFKENATYRLQENFRNTNEIVEFVKSFFPNFLITAGNLTGPKPKMICSNRSQEIHQSILLDLIQTFQAPTHNIAILAPIQKDVELWHNILSQNDITHSYYSSDMGMIDQIENVHVTTFKSAKGLEFDTVIIPNFDKYGFKIRLDVISPNDYYVGFTRARRNLFLIDDSPLQKGATQLNFCLTAIQNDLIEVDYNYIRSTASK